MGRVGSRGPAFSDEEITAAFLSALDGFRSQRGTGKPLTQEAVTSLIGTSTSSMSQWKQGTNISAATLVSAFVRLNLTITLNGHKIGLCESGMPRQQETSPEQLSLALDYQLAEEFVQTAYSRPIELGKTEEVVMRITVKKALTPSRPDTRASA